MGLWYRGSRVRVPLATLENKGFVSEGFVGPVGNPQKSSNRYLPRGRALRFTIGCHRRLQGV